MSFEGGRGTSCGRCWNKFDSPSHNDFDKKTYKLASLKHRSQLWNMILSWRHAGKERFEKTKKRYASGGGKRWEMDSVEPWGGKISIPTRYCKDCRRWNLRVFGNFFCRSQDFCLDRYQVFAPDSLPVPRDFPYYKSIFCAGKLYVCFKSAENAELSLCCLLKMPRGQKSPGSSGSIFKF